MILASSSVVFLDMGPQQAFGGTFPGTNGKIAFGSSRTGTEQIFVMNADGTGQTRLSNNAFNDGVPSWSPDGTKIAFHSLRTGNVQIFVMNADGTGQTNLSNNAFFNASPNWGPLAATTGQRPVGGIILPIDMTALFVAGAMTNSFWIVPTIGGIAGAAFALFKVKRKHQ